MVQDMSKRMSIPFDNDLYDIIHTRAESELRSFVMQVVYLIQVGISVEKHQGAALREYYMEQEVPNLEHIETA